MNYDDRILCYYLLKRLFLFFDEWLFYIILYKLFKKKYYKGFVAILLYGTGCIYTSYNNIYLIEKKIIPEDQDFFAISFDDIKKIINKFIPKNKLLMNK